MIPNGVLYVPALRWRTGEYQALLRLAEPVKQRIKPLITIPRIEFDFDDYTPRHTVQDHVKPFPGRYLQKWGPRPAWVDVNQSLHSGHMDNGDTVFTYVFDALRKGSAEAIPVASLDYNPSVIAEIAAIVALDNKGVAIRVRLEHLMLPDFSNRLSALIAQLEHELGTADLIVDLGTPFYEPYRIFCAALGAALSTIASLDEYRTFALIGSAFPDSLKDVAQPGGTVERHEWKFYKALLKNLPSKMRRPIFGDYTIVHPAFVAEMDMRVVKPAGKLVYTAQDQWIIRKGGAFRTDPAQMHEHCEFIVNSGKFAGPRFSSGDEYIALCANKKAGSSTLTRWKEIGINHHITHVLDDVARFGGPP